MNDYDLAKVGIVALIDEATGYQNQRPKDALRKMLPDLTEMELLVRLLTLSKPIAVKLRDDLFAGRILPLGLTGYGNTERKAIAQVERMTLSAIRAHQKIGTLTQWLDASGLNWRD